MDWGSIIITAITSGGVVYLLADKLVASINEKSEAKRIANEAEKISQEAESIGRDNQNKDVDTGLNALNFYQEFRTIIEKEVQKANLPLMAELVNVKTELKEIKDNWCCYRQNCEMRLWTKAEAGLVDDANTHSKDFLEKMG